VVFGTAKKGPSRAKDGAKPHQRRFSNTKISITLAELLLSANKAPLLAAAKLVFKIRFA